MREVRKFIDFAAAERYLRESKNKDLLLLKEWGWYVIYDPTGSLSAR